MASKKIRKIFFWILVFLFIATAPVVIFYARGYRFSFQQGIFIYAGSITIKSNPQKVDIFLDNKPSPRKKTNLINNSYHVDGIRPGEYFLEIKSPGYETWSKKISVHSGISTEFWNIVLAKNEYEKTDYQAVGVEKFFISPDRKLVAYTENVEQEFLVKIHNLESLETENIFSSLEYSFLEAENEIEKENIEWTPDSDKIIIPTKKDGQKNYFIIDLETKETTNLKDIAKTDILANVRWDSVRKNSLFYMSENKLSRINLNDLEITPIAENISHYDISGSDMYIFQIPSGITYKVRSKNGDIIDQLTTSPPDDMKDPDYRIIAYDEKRLVLFNKNGNLYVFNKGEDDQYFQKLSQDVLGIQFSDDGKKLLYWTDFEIVTYFTREWDVQPQRQENEIRYITRFSEEIKNVQWSKDYEHVLFSVGNDIKLIELDHRDHRNVMNLTSLQLDNSNVVANFIENKIYFTNTDGEKMNLYSIDFPEKTGFLGIR